MAKDGWNSDEITMDNYFTYTEGTFTPCEAPVREPDYKSKSSSYWYSEEGVIRQSNLWGLGIGSCSWGLAGETLNPCHKNKNLGQRTGFISWQDLRIPEKTLKVTHRFGQLDYEKLGVAPIEKGCDKFGAYDVFAVDRSWFEQGSDKYTFAGRTIAPAWHASTYTSALGDAYIDPQAQLMSVAWEAERQQCRRDQREIPEVDSWIATQVSNPEYGSLASELLSASEKSADIKDRLADDGDEPGLDSLESVARDASTIVKTSAPQQHDLKHADPAAR